MLQNAAIHPQVVNTVRMSEDDSSLQLFDANGWNLLFYAGVTADNTQIVLNDRINERWGEDVFLPLPGRDRLGRMELNFKLDAALEVWNGAGSVTFERFGPASGKEVRFALLKNVTIIGNTLLLSVPRSEEMAVRIASRVAMKRLDQIEQTLAGASDRNV